MRGRIVKKFQHERVAVERLLHDATLDDCPSAMDEPYLAQSGGVRFDEVLFDDGRDVSRGEGVEVEDAVDGDVEWVLILHRQEPAGFS
jgi:hypothetical protein